MQVLRSIVSNYGKIFGGTLEEKHANPKTQQETAIVPTQQTTTQPKHMSVQESKYDGNKVAKEVSEATRHNQVLEELERTRIAISVNGGIQQIRAFANYDKDGSFFDWVTVTWRLGRNSLSQTPARVLLIYDDKEDEISVLVQACFWQNQEDITSSTDISGRWRLEINNEETADERKRVIQSVKLKDVTDINYVVQHFGNPNEMFGLDAEELSVENAFVDVMELRYASWACQFLK
jgi:hypothetical protein